MYEFRDTVTVGSASEITLPSEAINFNGQWLDLTVPGFTTLNVSGRELLESEIEDLQIGSSDGVRYRKKRYPARTIVVTYSLHASSDSAFRSAYNKLNQILNAEQAKLIFNDEADKYFIATKAGNSEITPGQNCVTGEIEFYCADPFKYAVEETVVTPTLDNNSTFFVDYRGTYKTYPKIQATFSSDNGYIAFVDANKHILQFGSVEESDKVEDYIKSQDLIVDGMEEGVTGWTLNNAVTVGQQAFVQTGSFKRTIRHDQICLEPDSYGTGAQWHGPSFTKKVPADAGGSVGAKHCVFGWTHFLAIQGSGDNGIAQFVMTDENGKNVAAMTFYKTTTNNYKGYCKLAVNGQHMEDIPYDFSLDSSFTSWENGWSYMKKFANTIEFKVGTFLNKTYRVDAIKDMKVTEISFFLGAYGNRIIHHNGVRRVRFTKHHVKRWVDVPNKFSADDVLEVDCKTGNVTLSNIQEFGLGALGNDWEEFHLSPGTNQITCLYSDWAQKPDLTLRYREVFI